MIKTKIKNTKLYKRIALAKKLFSVMRTTPFYFIVQIASSFFVAFFDGLSIGLLVPLAKGIVDMDFSFLQNAPLFRNVIAWYPQIFIKAPIKFIFAVLVGIIFTAAIMKNVSAYLSSLYRVYQREKYLFNIKKFTFKRYISFGKMFFDKQSLGVINKTIDYAEQITHLLDLFAESLKQAFTFVIYIVILFMISWKLTLFAAIIFPISHYSLKWVVAKIRKTANLKTKTTLKLSQEVFNIFSCIPLVKAFGKEKEVETKFNQANELLRKLQFSMAKKAELINPLQETIMLSAILLVLSATAFVLIKGQLDEIAGFLVFFYVLRRAMPIFNSFAVIRSQIAQAAAPTKEVLKVFDDKDKFFITEGNKKLDRLKEKIEFRHLNYAYIKNTPVLKDLSFSIEKGKMTALVGPTGSGKTTIINLIMRFYDCQPKTIFIDDTDIREFTLESLRKHTALVSQEALLFNDTLRNNISFGVKGKVSEEELIKIVKKTRLYDFIMNLPQGFDTEVGDRGIRLSGGEKQRVSIARALLKGPDILILDEATSSLDTHTERLIQEAIEEAVKDRTTIVIAHRLSTIKNADKIVVIKNGNFIEDGALNELLDKKGSFYQYWEEQKFY